MKDAYYFSHDANARNDEKILMLRAEHGWEGYGIYWALIEMMFESSETALHNNKIKGIAVSYNIDITVLESVINTCIEEELFVADGTKFWSESLNRRKEKYKKMKEKKAEAGRKGMAKRWGKDNTVITENNKVKESKVKESKEKEKEYIPFQEIISYLNQKADKNFKHTTNKNKELIVARWNEGFKLEDYKRVIDIKCSKWIGTDAEQYLRPLTLFGTKFESYLNESTSQPQKQERRHNSGTDWSKYEGNVTNEIPEDWD